jgi:8-oxo-dGTP pyrophosphatase MutT (NUDIX family)
MTASTASLLAGYQPRSALETDHLERVRALVTSAPDPWIRVTPLHLTGSALIVHPPTRRVLLRWHRRQGTWLQVGGHGDPGESTPLAVAVREAVEETALTDVTPWPDAGLLHLAIVDVPASAHEPAHQHADLRFVLATADPDAARPEDDTAAVRWLDVAAARAATTSTSLRESLDRLAPLLS